MQSEHKRARRDHNGVCVPQRLGVACVPYPKMLCNICTVQDYIYLWAAEYFILILYFIFKLHGECLRLVVYLNAFRRFCAPKYFGLVLCG